MQPRSGVGVADLAALELFHGVEPTRLEALAKLLVRREYRRDEVLLRQGEPGESFVLILDGTVRVTRTVGSSELDLGSSGAGSIFGELSAITRDARRATVTASSPAVVAFGALDAFEVLLALPGLTAELRGLAAHRLAEIASVIPVELDDGTQLVIRPLLARDHEELAAALRHQPEEWIYSRFFSGGMPSGALIDYLTNVDYLAHFAWVVATPEPSHGIAVGRYIRLRDDGTEAELAFGVTDDWRGRGLGTLLLGALGVAAAHAGIERFRAETLAENRAMQRVLKKAGAKWQFVDGGVMETTFAVADAESLLPPGLRTQLADVATEIVSGAGLALRARPRSEMPDPS